MRNHNGQKGDTSTGTEKQRACTSRIRDLKRDREIQDVMDQRLQF